MPDSPKIVRGQIWHCKSNPIAFADPDQAFASIPKGAMVIAEDGRVVETGEATTILKKYQGNPIEDFGDAIICPGFVDAHTHFPQIDIMGSFGKTLLGWLDHYTFPEEEKFANHAHAQAVAMRFVDSLLSHGTTTAAIFGSSHRDATEALCEEVARRGMRAVVGKASMDRNAPNALLVDLEQEMEDLQELFERWHTREDRIYCALTPRFAPSCSEELLKALGKMKSKVSSAYVQSHVSENLDEIKLVRELFPKDADYFSVYERFGLTGPRCLYAHGIHLSNEELSRMASSGTSLVHCPSSNMFLGSGLFDLKNAQDKDLKIAFATDVGAGTTFSMLRTQLDAYKIQKLNHYSVNPIQLFYYATLGGATAMHMEETCGNFASGKAADFVVIDWSAESILGNRMARGCDNAEQVFAIATLADDRNVKKVFVQGQAVYERSA